MSSLFQALATFVPKDDAYLIRQKICNFLSLDRDKSYAQQIRWATNMDVVTYVSRMRLVHIRGSVIEIQAFCDLYNFSLLVYRNASPITFSPKRKIKGRLQVGHLQWQGDFYQAIDTKTKSSD